MPALNRVQLIGWLGKDPDVRQTTSGKKVTSFSVAVNRRWKSGSDTRETADWFNIETWGRQADFCEQYLKKGRLVFVEGRLQTDRYEVNGETRYFTKVVASQVQPLDRHDTDAISDEEELTD
ncbi:MAG: single-stranded DNA-binding protein [Chloroflexi bacterium]|jgi:single-strand DNA-binding protein|nr:single-stranded DNA-binding protein [Chloroflexota bacterium]